MTTRRRFTAEFKARVALTALRGDKTIQEIATKHKVHPNQVSAWKRQAVEGLGAVFSNGPDKARLDHDEEVAKFSFQVQHRYALELRWEHTMISSTLMSDTSCTGFMKPVQPSVRLAA